MKKIQPKFILRSYKIVVSYPRSISFYIYFVILDVSNNNYSLRQFQTPNLKKNIFKRRYSVFRIQFFSVQIYISNSDLVLLVHLICIKNIISLCVGESYALRYTVGWFWFKFLFQKFLKTRILIRFCRFLITNWILSVMKAEFKWH